MYVSCVKFLALTISVLLALNGLGKSSMSAMAKQRTGDDDFAANMQQARALLNQQKFADAETILKTATTKFPDKPGGWYLLGYSLHGQQKYDDALKAYGKAKEYPQVRQNALYNIACIYSLQDNADSAIETLQSAIDIGFNNFGQILGDSDFDNIKDDPRFIALLPKFLGDDELFVEPTRIIHKWMGETAGDQFGWTARKCGDMDQDGIIDFITTAPTYKNGSGKIYVYSTKSGKLLHSVVGKPGEQLGNSAVGIGDVDNDGIPDFVAGAPTPGGFGHAYVFSGKSGDLLHSFAGDNKGDQFGYEVSEAGDLDLDNVPDFFVGALAGNGKVERSGTATAISGKSGKVIFTLEGERSGDGFGNAIAAKNSDKDNILLAVGAKNAGPNKRGQVDVYKISNGKPAVSFKIDGDDNSVNLGQMFISFPGDLNRDGIPDVYASDFSDNTKVRGGGKIVVHSGRGGKQLLAIHGENAGEGLGTSPSDAGDVDGDGIGDLVIGAWQNAQGSPSGGKVYLYSCADGGKLLRTWTCKQSGDTLGFDATGIGDVDGDGHVDFLLTSAWSNVAGAKSGRVFVVAGSDYSTADQTD